MMGIPQKNSRNRRPARPWNLIADVLTNLLVLVFIFGLFGFLAIIKPSSDRDQVFSCTKSFIEEFGPLIAEEFTTLSLAKELPNKRCEITILEDGFKFFQASVIPAQDASYDRFRPEKKLEPVLKVDSDRGSNLFTTCRKIFSNSRKVDLNPYDVKYILRGKATGGYQEPDRCNYPRIYNGTLNDGEDENLEGSQVFSRPDVLTAYELNQIPNVDMETIKRGERNIYNIDYNDILKAEEAMCNYTYASQRAVNIQKMCMLHALSGEYGEKTGEALNFFRENIFIEVDVVNEPAQSPSNPNVPYIPVEVVLQFSPIGSEVGGD